MMPSTDYFCCCSYLLFLRETACFTTVSQLAFSFPAKRFCGSERKNGLEPTRTMKMHARCDGFEFIGAKGGKDEK